MSCFSASLWSALSRSLTSTPPEEEMQTPMVAEGGDRGDGGREQGVCSEAHAGNFFARKISAWCVGICVCDVSETSSATPSTTAVVSSSLLPTFPTPSACCHVHRPRPPERRRASSVTVSRSTPLLIHGGHPKELGGPLRLALGILESSGKNEQGKVPAASGRL